jgi:hypothetical protein
MFVILYFSFLFLAQWKLDFSENLKKNQNFWKNFQDALMIGLVRLKKAQSKTSQKLENLHNKNPPKSSIHRQGFSNKTLS